MAITTTGDVSFDQTAYELRAFYALRPELYFDAVADVQPTNQSMPGKSVVFTIVTDLAVASTALDESTDVTPATMGDSQVTVTLAEYGNAVKTTAFLRGTSFIPYDPVVANAIGFNAGISFDTLPRDVLKAGTNVGYASSAGNTPTARNQVSPPDVLAGNNVRKSLAFLRGGNVQPFPNGMYKAFIHPDVSYDLRGSTGGANWRDPHTYSQPEQIWQGAIGAFEGFEFIETPRAPIFTDAGSSTTLTDVYATLFMGRQALAKAYSSSDGNGPMPRIVPGPVTDTLRRFVPLGWRWLGGFARFRESCLRRVESASSIGTNA